MRIGILTYHAVCNFGANLQALSTIEYLRTNGHEPIIINWYPEELEKAYLKNTPKEQFEIHRLFREKHFMMTERCYSDNDVAKVIDECKLDAIIVGSDAVVQYTPYISRIIFPCRKIIHIEKPGKDRDCPNPFWGSFCKYLKRHIPMAMMSVSSQNSPYKTLLRKERKKMSEHIEQFCYISTRDDWTQKQFKYATRNNISPIITPDPVFAFSHNVDYLPTKEEICKRFNLPDNYILVSFHNSHTVSIEWLSELKHKCEQKTISCVAFPFPQGIKYKHPFDKEIQTPLDPIDWYALIKYSQGYIGHNMHPIVVSLSNAVPCFSFDNYGNIKFRIFVNQKSSKIYHIMNHFGVLQNRVNSSGKFIDHPTVDYVIGKLESYNKDYVMEVAKNYLQDYKKMMENIMITFLNVK